MIIFAVSCLLLLSCTGLAQGNGCCWFPCENRGVCVEKPDSSYWCDCTSTGYYGMNCTTPTLATRLKNLITPSTESVHHLVSHFSWLWSLANKSTWVRSIIMGMVLKVRTHLIDIPPIYSANGSYTTVDTVKNLSFYARTLPPVPTNCPTPMGVHGGKELPDIERVIEAFFKRKQFKPNRIRCNMLFTAYAQHFTHMFFKTDNVRGFGMQWGDHNVFLSNLYGDDKRAELLLRSFQGGKLLSQWIGVEEFPLMQESIPELYSANPLKLNAKSIFAIGHPYYNLFPTLTYWQTLFLREHNRVATMLAKEHPHWNDEQIFQTTRLIMIGQTLKITVEDYVQHLSNYKFKLMFDPALLYGDYMQYQNRIHYEFAIMYHWHPLMPDNVVVDKHLYTLKQWYFNGTLPLLQHGTVSFTKAFVNSIAGEIGPHNHADDLLIVIRNLIKDSRKMRVQSFNQYRKRFKLPALISFEQLTKDSQLQKNLKDLYGHIDAVELYVGLIVEDARSRSIFGQTMIEFGSPYSLQGIFGNAFASPSLWRPSTFGGESAFKYMNSATLRRFVCSNLPRSDKEKPLPPSTLAEEALLEVQGSFMACPVSHVQFGVPLQETLNENSKQEL